MAGLAGLAKPALVGIVPLVTANAHVGSFPIGVSRLVTRAARDGTMPAFQLIVRLGMIEGAFVEADDIGFRTLVFRMAMPALGFRGDWAFRVKTPLLRSVLGDLVMAVQAESGLRFSPKWRMTLVAALLVFPMSLGERPRHDELFEYGLSGGQIGGRTHPDCNQDECKLAHDFRLLVQMDSDHVGDGRENQHQEQGHVQEVPEREQMFVDGEARRLSHGSEVSGDISFKFLAGLAEFLARAGLDAHQFDVAHTDLASNRARELP